MAVRILTQHAACDVNLQVCVLKLLSPGVGRLLSLSEVRKERLNYCKFVAAYSVFFFPQKTESVLPI